MSSITPSDTAANEAERTQRQQVVWVIIAAGLMGFTGLRIVWLAARHDPQMHVPRPIAFVLAFIMVAGPAMAVLKVLGRGKHMDWLAVLVLLGMTVLFGWVGRYGDPRDCSVHGPPFLPLPSCHTAFSAFTVLLLLMTVLAARGWWRSVVARRLRHQEPHV